MTGEQITATIWGEDDEEIDIDGIYRPGMKGLRDYYGQRETPDDPEEVELLHAFGEDGKEIELTEEQTSRAVEALWEAL